MAVMAVYSGERNSGRKAAASSVDDGTWATPFHRLMVRRLINERRLGAWHPISGFVFGFVAILSVAPLNCPLKLNRVNWSTRVEWAPANESSAALLIKRPTRSACAFSRPTVFEVCFSFYRRPFSDFPRSGRHTRKRRRDWPVAARRSAVAGR